MFRFEVTEMKLFIKKKATDRNGNITFREIAR